jgi:hypothetical protein
MRVPRRAEQFVEWVIQQADRLPIGGLDNPVEVDDKHGVIVEFEQAAKTPDVLTQASFVSLLWLMFCATIMPQEISVVIVNWNNLQTDRVFLIDDFIGGGFPGQRIAAEGLKLGSLPSGDDLAHPFAFNRVASKAKPRQSLPFGQNVAQIVVEEQNRRIRQMANQSAIQFDLLV